MLIITKKPDNQVINNYRNHDDNSPLLIGNLKETDIIKEAKQESWIERNEKLF